MNRIRAFRSSFKQTVVLELCDRLRRDPSVRRQPGDKPALIRDLRERQISIGDWKDLTPIIGVFPISNLEFGYAKSSAQGRERAPSIRQTKKGAHGNGRVNHSVDTVRPDSWWGHGTAPAIRANAGSRDQSSRPALLRRAPLQTSRTLEPRPSRSTRWSPGAFALITSP